MKNRETTLKLRCEEILKGYGSPTHPKYTRYGNPFSVDYIKSPVSMIRPDMIHQME